MDLRTNAIIKQLVGGLDTDTSLLNVAPNDYVDAKNLTNRGDINEQSEIQILRGSDTYFSLPAVAAQEKTQVLKTLQDVTTVIAPTVLNFDIYNQNGDSVISTTYTAPYASVAALAALISADITAAGFSGGCAGSTIGGYTYFQVSLGAEALYDNWYIESSWSDVAYSEISVLTELEAINTNLSGSPYVIGKRNIVNDLFIWATPITKNSFDYFDPVGGLAGVITSISNVLTPAVSSNTRIVFNLGHELVTGNEIKISGFTAASGATHLNGIWNVSVFDPVTIDIVMSRFTVYDPYLGVDVGAIMDYYIAGYGLIYRTFRDKTTGNFDTPTRLIGARKLNFCTLNQIDNFVKLNNYNAIFEFTDFRNRPCLLVYNGAYTTDGFMSAPVSNGRYEYDTLDLEKDLIISDSPLKITDVSQSTEGNLTTTSYVYYVRGVIDDYTKTTWSAPSGTCIVTLIDTTDTSTENELQFQGDEDGVTTTKSNNITVSNIPAGVYKYIEIACVMYGNTSVTGNIIKRVQILTTDTEIIISHLSNSENIGTLDLTTLNQTYLQIEKALNIVEIDNSTVLSNCELTIDENLDSWAQTIEFAVRRTTVGNPQTFAGAIAGVTGMQFNGYQLFENVYNYPSYMLFETARIGIQLKRRGGGWTKAYWVADVSIDNSAVAGRRIGTLANYALWVAGGGYGLSYVFYLEFSNIDLDYITLNGRTIKQDYEDIRFVQVPIRKQIMSTGISIISYLPAGVNYPYRYPAAIPGTADRSVTFFWSPDTTRVDGTSLSYSVGDTLVTLGSALVEATTATATGNIVEFTGQVTAAGTHVIDGIIKVSTGSTAGNTGPFPPIVSLIDATGGPPTVGWQEAYAISTTTNVVNVGANPDLGVYITYIRRPDTVGYPVNKYEDEYVPVPIQTAFDFDTHSTATIISVYGGDSFTGKTFLFMKTDIGGGNEMAFGFYSQMRANIAFRHNSFPGFLYSTTSNTMALIGDDYTNYTIMYLRNNLETGISTLSNANKYRNELNSIAGYNEDTEQIEESLATVFWSLPSPEDSMLNSRVFLSSNQRALELVYGAIMQMLVVRDRLITIQQDKIEAQYFDNTGKLVSDTTDILLGTGAVMGRRGDYVTGYGTNSKWGCFLGKSDGGGDVMYVIDTLRRRITRFGLDGTTDFTDNKKVSRFLQKGLQFSNWFLTPANKAGSHGGWDDKNKWVYFSVMAYNETLKAWADGDSYITGEHLYYKDISLLNYGDYVRYMNGAPIFWVCTGDHTADPSNSPIVSSEFWSPISLYNTDYYNWYTLIFSELENRFKWFISPVPSIWLEYQNTILSPSVLTDKQSDIYEYNELGETARWFCFSYATVYAVSYTQGSTAVVADTSWNVAIPDTFTNGFDVKYYLLVGSEYIEMTIDDIYGATANATLLEPAGATGVLVPLTYRICLSNDANIKGVVNEVKGNNVKFVAIKYESSEAPSRVDMVTNRVETHLDDTDFENYDEFYSSSIKNDETGGALNTDNTSQTYGKYMTVDTIIKNGDSNIINNFAVKVRKLKGG